MENNKKNSKKKGIIVKSFKIIIPKDRVIQAIDKIERLATKLNVPILYK